MHFAVLGGGGRATRATLHQRACALSCLVPLRRLEHLLCLGLSPCHALTHPYLPWPSVLLGPVLVLVLLLLVLPLLVLCRVVRSVSPFPPVSIPACPLYSPAAPGSCLIPTHPPFPFLFPPPFLFALWFLPSCSWPRDSLYTCSSLAGARRCRRRHILYTCSSVAGARRCFRRHILYTCSSVAGARRCFRRHSLCTCSSLADARTASGWASWVLKDWALEPRPCQMWLMCCPQPALSCGALRVGPRRLRAHQASSSCCKQLLPGHPFCPTSPAAAAPLGFHVKDQPFPRNG